ncbi:MAG: hypothetical protein ABI461_02165, partial [Polyangiaceae bacterium]
MRHVEPPAAHSPHLVEYDDDDPMMSTDVNVARHGSKSSVLGVVKERVVPPPFPMRPRAASEATWLFPVQDSSLPPAPPASVASQAADFDFSEFDPAFEDDGAILGGAPAEHRSAANHALPYAATQLAQPPAALPFAATQLAVPFVMPPQSERSLGVKPVTPPPPAPKARHRRGLRRTIVAGLLSIGIGASATAAWCGLITEQDLRYDA